jgi:hypothetical protein
LGVLRVLCDKEIVPLVEGSEYGGGPIGMSAAIGKKGPTRKEFPMKKTIFVVCFVLLAAPVYAALGDRHVEQAGGFSLQAPKG